VNPKGGLACRLQLAWQRTLMQGACVGLPAAWSMESARASSAAALEGICAHAVQCGSPLSRLLLQTLMPFAPIAFVVPGGKALMRGLCQLLGTLPLNEALPSLSMLLSAPVGAMVQPQADPLFLTLNLDLLAAWVSGACACMAPSTEAMPLVVLSPALDAALAGVKHPSTVVAEAACSVLGEAAVGCCSPALSTRKSHSLYQQMEFATRSNLSGFVWLAFSTCACDRILSYILRGC
jgi:hypothetical protein